MGTNELVSGYPPREDRVRKPRRYAMVGEESKLQKQKRLEKEQKEAEEQLAKEMKAKKELRWMWGGFVVFAVGWFVYGLWCDVPAAVAVVLSLIGGWGCVFFVIMTIVLFQDIKDGNFSGGGGGFSIPAPSKQTQRMLRRNIRRRWF